MNVINKKDVILLGSTGSIGRSALRLLRENKDKFKIGYVDPPIKLSRKDIRLPVDYPEDLVVCRAIYEYFKSYEPNIPLLDVVDFLDRNPQLLKLTSPFCEEGYKTMYL